MLRILTEFGGDPSILYVNKPHIGTDVLSRIVKSIRTEIESWEARSSSKAQVTGFCDGWGAGGIQAHKSPCCQRQPGS
ncbi:MAG: hypothetical protein ACLTBV_23175 [Enterocloster bolteae]